MNGWNESVGDKTSMSLGWGGGGIIMRVYNYRGGWNESVGDG